MSSTFDIHSALIPHGHEKTMIPWEPPEFACVECGFGENADNVLRRGRRQLACEVSGAVMPQQQEPVTSGDAKVTPDKSGITYS